VPRAVAQWRSGAVAKAARPASPHSVASWPWRGVSTGRLAAVAATEVSTARPASSLGRRVGADGGMGCDL
jgi:hypothetical protein